MLEEKNLGYLGEGITNATVMWQEPRATAAPKDHHSPSKELDNPTRFSHPIVRDRGHAHPQSTSWQGLTHLVERGKPPEKHLSSACRSPSKLADIASHREGISLRARKTN